MTGFDWSDLQHIDLKPDAYSLANVTFIASNARHFLTFIFKCLRDGCLVGILP